MEWEKIAADVNRNRYSNVRELPAGSTIHFSNDPALVDLVVVVTPKEIRYAVEDKLAVTHFVDMQRSELSLEDTRRFVEALYRLQGAE